MSKPKIYIILTWHVEAIQSFDKTPILNIDFVERIKNIFFDEQIIKHNLLLQADISIEKASGSANFIFQNWEQFWRQKQEKGHEIGWHFHPIVLDSIWRQSVLFEEFRDSLERAYNSIQGLFNVGAVSTGWCFGSNDLLKAYDSFGLKVDASCLPGLRCKGKTPKTYGKLGEVNKFDWFRSKDSPYFPSIDDYQVDGEKHLEIMEIPVLTDGALLFSLNDHPRFYESMLATVFRFAKTKKHPVVLHGYSHSYNMTGRGLDYYKSNMRNLFSYAEKYDVELNFLTLSELRSKWIEQGEDYILPRLTKPILLSKIFVDKLWIKLSNGTH